jgi:hypothetical protein
MLAERFFLFLEEIIRRVHSDECHADGSTKVVSASPHIPIRLPTARR